MSQIMGVGDENGIELMTRVRVGYTYLVQQLVLIVQREERNVDVWW